MNKRIAALIIAAVAAGLIVFQVFALIIDSSGQLIVLPPPVSVLPGDHESNVALLAFDEAQGVLLTKPLSTSISSPGHYAVTADLAPGVIDAGILINCSLIHEDAISNTNEIVLVGSITIDTPILGVLILNDELDATDGACGLPTTTYPTDASKRGLELDFGPDAVTVSNDQRMVTVTLKSSTAFDQVRIVSKATAPPKLVFLPIVSR